MSQAEQQPRPENKRVDLITRRMTINRYYRVPCVKLTTFLLGCDPGTVLPVIGPSHDDKEIIGVANEHWHIDFRFVRQKIWKRWGDGYFAHARIHGDIIFRESTDGAVTTRRMRYQREMPQFPKEIPFPMGDRSGLVPWLGKLEAAYIDHELKPGCAVCPHRGLPLNDLPSRDGVVVCPGHGLAWDLNTGRLVPRVMPTRGPAVIA